MSDQNASFGCTGHIVATRWAGNFSLCSLCDTESLTKTLFLSCPPPPICFSELILKVVQDVNNVVKEENIRAVSNSTTDTF